ncbi:UPF0565 protein C2orf69 [Orussus abietinus]|uniref:UPF0565 protein C2orf69 n=1 Tax=Orussus abietinus TaxID=222816 RepID=UPI000624FE95|nr:UPF0565 protein C2orf69 [Orussus abietinus]
MASKILYLRKMSGLAGRSNDILYLSPLILSRIQRLLIFFGGDVQDLEEAMKVHNDSKKYLRWSLESTMQLLAARFPRNHVIVIRPSRMEDMNYGVFACYDNFVPGNKYGVPTFSSSLDALKHLEKLLLSVSTYLASQDTSQGIYPHDIERAELVLMGFSKGCVVLNQILHEFHTLHTQQIVDKNLKEFVERIKDMAWLDGGHCGKKDTWITNKSILESFSKLKINVHVHVTPQQVRDEHRPWIRKEEESFCNILQRLGVLVEHSLHYENDQRSLEMHFDVLAAIKEEHDS